MLTNKVKENDKLKNHQSQIIEMHADYEDMKKTREEAKKQMEAKFSDINNNLNKTEDNIKDQKIRLTNKIEDFKSNTTSKLNNLDESIHKDFTEEQEFVRIMFEKQENRMNLLEKMIRDEREERLRHTEEELNPIRKQLKNLQTQYESGKAERLQHEKEIYKKIKEEVKLTNEIMDKEKNDRNERMQILKEDRDKEMNLRDSLFHDFDKKVNISLEKEKVDVMQEMENRFKHQNEVVDDISNFINAFQGTLKIVGKDV